MNYKNKVNQSINVSEYQKRLDFEYKQGIDYFKKTVVNNDLLNTEFSKEIFNDKQKTEIK